MESFHDQSFSHRHASVIRQLLVGGTRLPWNGVGRPSLPLKKGGYQGRLT